MSIGEILLIGAGVLVVIYAVLGLARWLGHRPGLTLAQTLSVLLAVLATVAAELIGAAGAGSGLSSLPMFGVAAALSLVGVIGFALERSRGPVGLDYSAGMLGLGAGLLLAIYLVGMPLVRDRVVTPLLISRSAPVISRASDVELVGALERNRLPSNVVIGTPIPPITPNAALPTPTPTPFIYQDPLATAAVTPVGPSSTAAAAPTNCTALVDHNLNLRGAEQAHAVGRAPSGHGRGSI